MLFIIRYFGVNHLVCWSQRGTALRHRIVSVRAIMLFKTVQFDELFHLEMIIGAVPIGVPWSVLIG